MPSFQLPAPCSISRALVRVAPLSEPSIWLSSVTLVPASRTSTDVTVLSCEAILVTLGVVVGVDGNLREVGYAQHLVALGQAP